jgi:menaquinone-dependent protoporphyrinogen oxidase
MSKSRILIAYATRYGATQEVAGAITDVLRNAGFEVDMLPMGDIVTLESYGAVVLGAAIYNARWHPDAHHFLLRHEETLRQRPAAIFALGPVNTSAGAMRNSRRQLDQELEKVPWLKPVAIEMFVGKYDPTRPGLSFFDRFLPASDHRDWDAIRTWAKILPGRLQDGEEIDVLL